ncbi:MAG: hypothetical protein AAB496_00435 [Patescibacteria group bacterium]
MNFKKIISTTSVFAAGLVPCGPGLAKSSCSFCDFLTLGQNIINLGIKLAIPIAVAIIIAGGFMIMFSAGSTERVSTGKKIITSAVVGVIIALAAWLIVDITFRVLAGQTPAGLENPWYQIGKNINCQ